MKSLGGDFAARNLSASTQKRSAPRRQALPASPVFKPPVSLGGTLPTSRMPTSEGDYGSKTQLHRVGLASRAFRHSTLPGLETS